MYELVGTGSGRFQWRAVLNTVMGPEAEIILAAGYHMSKQSLQSGTDEAITN
jgi:hypothetical protein